MWAPPWVKTRRSSDFSAADLAGSNFPRSPSFSLSSLKDIQTLARDDDNDGSFSSVPTSAPASFRRIFHRVRVASSALRAFRSPAASAAPDCRIVIYYTSLRVVRKTFEDCRAIRSILRGFRVAVDERDVSMDAGFLVELKGLLKGRAWQQIGLPQLFIGGRYVGGAEEIRRLHESGDLKRLIEGALVAPAVSCEGCGGVRFVLCGRCNGSHKRYSDKGGFRSCGDCNENGLVRCPDCSGPAAH